MHQFRPGPRACAQRRHLAGALGAVLFGVPAWPAGARQTFPNRVIRMLPFGSAGGPIDSIARIYSEKLKARWGRSVVVDAKPGASGLLAAAAIAKSPPTAAP